MSESIARAPAPNPKRTLRETLARRRLDAQRAPRAHDALARRVLAILAQCAPRTVGFYWPLPGEFDARDAIASWLAGDASRQAALPVIGKPRTPLEFHAWTPDAPMREGRHRIAEPAAGARLVPELLLIPCVGFDHCCFRLGYGGGYYDRTLAAWPGTTPPVTVGVAYDACGVRELPREAHDLPLDWIVTETRLYRSDD
ncbi:5-formyltetrahydrofolate cyclo-ligase [Burkholderia pseudomallei]|uniref:5-formyltetrahydrofolate cyclo-ligase n=1 Tax=Burkholderia pseudomallei TaxID=28450 RepID=UPI000F04639A|nr:5-formyltetrahydrofolate cyclo-ligase [Burkholderia pseudomallei]VBM47524.1 5-formyltetrahydrofolate cyclo-ligase [Burkholderia pseudomallei]VBT57406.1 5-formyltetrahydrofolate cyclo-ligase [Burkholderia pseudomallei]VBW26379.1 5-formyltetrahydrofolate cyclo-ligase [Burkholderia pseudomallei]